MGESRAVPPMSTTEEGTITKPTRVPGPVAQKTKASLCDPCVMGSHDRCCGTGCYGCDCGRRG